MSIIIYLACATITLPYLLHVMVSAAKAENAQRYEKYPTAHPNGPDKVEGFELLFFSFMSLVGAIAWPLAIIIAAIYKLAKKMS